MKVYIEADIREIRAGIEAYSPALNLAGHGIDKSDALDTLHGGVMAWCEGLQRRGELERALKSRRARWEPGDGPLTVEITPSAG